MKTTIIIKALLAITLLTASCKKSAENSDPMTMLMKSWKVTAESDTNSSGATTDLYALSNACERDDLYKFLANNVFTYDEGATKCDPRSPQSESGTWSYDPIAKKIVVNLGSPVEWDVAELTNTTLKAITTSSFGGNVNTFTTTYTAQ